MPEPHLDQKLAKIPERINLVAWATFTSDGCPMCSYKKDGPLIRPKGGEWHFDLNGKLLFHIRETHGLGPSDVIPMVVDFIFKNEKEREAWKSALLA